LAKSGQIPEDFLNSHSAFALQFFMFQVILAISHAQLNSRQHAILNSPQDPRRSAVKPDGGLCCAKNSLTLFQYVSKLGK
jgi:hypothetical protein